MNYLPLKVGGPEFDPKQLLYLVQMTNTLLKRDSRLAVVLF